MQGIIQDTGASRGCESRRELASEEPRVIRSSHHKPEMGAAVLHTLTEPTWSLGPPQGPIGGLSEPNLTGQSC